MPDHRYALMIVRMEDVEKDASDIYEEVEEVEDDDNITLKDATYVLHQYIGSNLW